MQGLLVIAALFADPEPVKPPKGPPPDIAFCKMEGGSLKRNIFAFVPEEFSVKVKYVKDGKTYEKEERRTRLAVAIVMSELPPAGLTFTTAGGKKIEAAEARKKLGAGAIAAFSADGRPVDPSYLKALKPDTVVVVAPVYGAPTPVPKAG